MSRPCGDHLVTSRPEKNYLHSIKTHLLDIHILKLHHLHLLRDIVSKICYCRSYRSLSVTGFDRNGLVPYGNASSIKAIIWSDFVIIAIATFALEILCSQTTSETEQLHILVTMHFTRFSESKKAFRSDT